MKNLMNLLGILLIVSVSVFITETYTRKTVAKETEARVRAEVLASHWGRPVNSVLGMPDVVYEVVTKDYPFVIIKTIEVKPRVYLIFSGVIDGSYSPGDKLHIAGQKMEKQ